MPKKNIQLVSIWLIMQLNTLNYIIKLDLKKMENI